MNNLQTELQTTKTELIQVIGTIDGNKFNTIPFENSWTAAQVTEHILKAIGIAVLYGETEPTERAPDEKVAETAKLFLNLDIKMESPDFIYPSDKKHIKEEILNQITDIFSKLTEASNTLDLAETCLMFEIPGFGKFTRLEFVWFYIIHTKRHIHQLKNIAKILAD